MKEEIKTQKGFIQIPLLILVIVSIAVISVGAYAGFEYYKTSELLKEADQFIKKEKYKEAIGKLTLAQAGWFVKNLGIKKQEIANKQKEAKKLAEDLSKYNQGLDELNKGNYQEAINLFSQIPENSFYFNNAKLKIEETKRKMVEEELGKVKIAKREAEEKAQQEAIKRTQAEEKARQEAIKRRQAEVKAKKEEFERKLKEQQLLEKEAEERRMNADNDGDGLTYREELKLGTSDWNSDSDGDGIKDGEDAHPAGGGRNIPQTFAWNYGGYNWTWTEYIHEDWYEYYKAKPRGSAESVEYITSDDPFIKKIAKKISEGAKGDIGDIWLAVSFVQNLPYVDDIFTGYNETPKYPVETFFEKNGDCEDMSYLAASIIDAMGYGVVLVLLPGHMAIGIYMDCDTPGTYYKVDGKCYYYVETTSNDFAPGEIPDRYCNTQATIIKIPSGETVDVYPQYIKPCYASPDFSGYYSDGENFYSDSQCNHLTNCLHYKEFYVNPQTSDIYWDSSCSQIVVEGCYKSDTYPGYFYDDTLEYYSDSRCILKVRLCRPSPNYSDTYYDGYNEYWDSNCTQKVVPWCYKSIYYPGYFFNSIDSEIYIDSECTQKANL